MGYLVRDFCHATTTQAWAHVTSLVKSGDYNWQIERSMYWNATTSQVQALGSRISDTVGISGSVYSIAWNSVNNTTLGGFNVTFASCDAEFEGEFMPWADTQALITAKVEEQSALIIEAIEASAGGGSTVSFIEANGVAIVGYAVVSFWLARLAGKQR